MMFRGAGLWASVVLIALAAGQPAGLMGQEPGVAAQPSTLLPTDRTSRDAVATAASVVPPQVASSDITGIAGEYSYGNGFDDNCTLEISADGRFIYKRCNCETVVYQAQGTVSLQDGQLRLNSEKAPDAWGAGSSDVLVPVSWGQRLYLVPHNDLAGFSNHVNRGTEPVTRGSMGSYFLREGDWDRPAPGKPELPGDWKARLLDEPLHGQVAGKDPSGRWIINLGKNQKVYDAMELSAWAPDGQRYVTLRVTETGTSTSAVEIMGPRKQAPIQAWNVYSRLAPPTREKDKHKP